ncbi:Ubiquitin carboxyl-terminal hydrolase 3, partial [Camelus dromedarius]
KHHYHLCHRPSEFWEHMFHECHPSVPQIVLQPEPEYLTNIEQFCCYFKELPAVELRNGKTAGRRMCHTRSQGDNNV